jgi:hypothetical protein
MCEKFRPWYVRDVERKGRTEDGGGEMEIRR